MPSINESAPLNLGERTPPLCVTNAQIDPGASATKLLLRFTCADMDGRKRAQPPSRVISLMKSRQRRRLAPCGYTSCICIRKQSFIKHTHEWCGTGERGVLERLLGIGCFGAAHPPTPTQQSVSRAGWPLLRWAR